MVLVVAPAGAQNLTKLLPAGSIINQTYVLDSSGTTPFTLWVGAAVLGFALLILSCWHFPGGEEDFISVLAWIPLGFAMFTSLAVDRVTSAGGATSATGGIIVTEVHTIYNWWPIGIILFVILVFAIANTYRIVHNAKKESLPQQVQEGG
jgi:hypothetical protein